MCSTAQITTHGENDYGAEQSATDTNNVIIVSLSRATLATSCERPWPDMLSSHLLELSTSQNPRKLGNNVLQAPRLVARLLLLRGKHCNQNTTETGVRAGETVDITGAF